jgi:peroxiredoxin
MKSKRRRPSSLPILLFIAGGLLLVIAIALLLTGRPAPTQAIQPLQLGQPLQDFSLDDLNGRAVKLSNYAGQIVLINAWATWCPPCVAEMPDLQAYYQQHKDESFTILGINAGDSLSAASAFASQNGITFPIVLDPNVEFLSDLGVHSFPTSILVDADGVVQSIHVGMYTAEDLDAEITPYLR